MKLLNKIIINITVTMVLPLTVMQLSLISAPANNTTATDTQQLKDFPLDTFEECEDWRAFATSPLKETKIKKVMQQGEIYDVFNKDALTDAEKQHFQPPGNDGVPKNHVMGVKTWFNQKGFDRVEFKPPHELPMKGTVRQLSVWVLGRNFGHNFFIKLRDYQGNIHKLKVGKLNYMGWRKLTLTIPGWLPQSSRYALLDKNLHFVSFFVESDNFEPMGTYYFYVDYLTAKIDKTDMVYPGSEIKDIW